jgi:hypothetical protein
MAFRKSFKAMASGLLLLGSFSAHVQPMLSQRNRASGQVIFYAAPGKIMAGGNALPCAVTADTGGRFLP